MGRDAEEQVIADSCPILKDKSAGIGVDAGHDGLWVKADAMFGQHRFEADYERGAVVERSCPNCGSNGVRLETEAAARALASRE